MPIKRRQLATPARWDLWEHGVTQGFINSFLSCREQTRLRYVQAWTPYGAHLSFSFGGACHHAGHRAREWAVENKTSKTPPGRKVIGKWLEEFEKRWKAEHRWATGADKADLEKALGLACVLLPHYFAHWWEVDRVRKWSHVETTFAAPYVYPDGRTTYIRGRFDGACIKGGERWLFERKCLSVIDDESIAETLPLNTQCHVYFHGLAYVGGERPCGVLYDVLRRPGQRQGVNEDLPAFLKRADEDVSKKNRADHYFYRWEVRVTPSEQAAWRKKFLDPVMNQIRDWHEGKPNTHWPNPDALVTKYGRSAYFDAIVSGDFSRLHQRPVVFSELEEI